MSNEEISLFEHLPSNKEFSLLSVEILNGKSISKEVTHNNYANGFLYTGEKILLPKTSNIISSSSRVKMKHSFQYSIQNTALNLLLFLAHDLWQLALSFNSIYYC